MCDDVTLYGGANTVIQTGGELRLADGRSHLILGTGSLVPGSPRYELTAGSVNLPLGDLLIRDGYESVFLQNGGSCTVGDELVVGSSGDIAGAYARYEINDGDLHAGSLWMGQDGGLGRFVQTGGVVTVAGTVQLGDYLDRSHGVYEISGGELNASSLQFGNKGTGLFDQSGGDVAVDHLNVPATDTYVMSAGSLRVGASTEVKGTLDFAGGAGQYTGSDGSYTNFAQASLLNAANVRMDMGENSVAVFPAGFDPYADLAGYSSRGLTHISGTPLTIPAGTTIEVAGEFSDRLIVSGVVRNRPGEGLDLHGGVEVFPGGSVTLGRVENACTVSVNNLNSGCFGGLLDAHYLNIGDDGDGRFVQDSGLTRVDALRIGNGYNACGDGHFDMRGGSFETFQLIMGHSNHEATSTSHYLQTGGAASVRDFLAGEPSTVEIQGGSLEVGKMVIARSSYTQTGGNVAIMTNGGPGTGGNGSLSVERTSVAISGGALSADWVRLHEVEATQSGGAVAAPTVLFVGRDGTNRTMYALTGAGALTTGTLHIQGRNSLLDQSGGTLAAQRMEISDSQFDAYAVYRMSGGFATISDELVVGKGYKTWSGYDVGELHQSGGTLVANRVRVTDNSTVQQTGGALTVDGEFVCDGAWNLSGGRLDVGDEIRLGQAGADRVSTLSGGAVTAAKLTQCDDTLLVFEEAARLVFGEYEQCADATLITTVGADGFSTIDVSGAATLAGTWELRDAGAPLGEFRILAARGGLSAPFGEVLLPDSGDWSYRVESDVLWATHVPEPSTLVLLTLGGFLGAKRKRSR
ncbi:MAG: PEP-CTERM sorting domain-containing protein [Planctomycetes bacterium]|nr:PEP-CTERM sorting domain-containing protein [Planctomycetota bacterium]